MKIMIIEDEPASQEYLKAVLLEHYSHFELKAVTDNVPEALEMIRLHQPDIVFLDVEIKLGTGLDVLAQIPLRTFEVVFTTAYNTFAVEAFRFHAIDYLLKPLDKALIIEATDRCIQRIRNKDRNDQVEQLLRQLQVPAGQKAKLSIPAVEGIEFVALNDIVYGEAKGNYTDLFLATGMKLTATRKIKEIEERLPVDQFFRIHHSYIVNMQYVTRYHKGRGGYLLLKNGASLPVSSARKEEFLHWLG